MRGRGSRRLSWTSPTTLDVSCAVAGMREENGPYTHSTPLEPHHQAQDLVPQHAVAIDSGVTAHKTAHDHFRVHGQLVHVWCPPPEPQPTAGLGTCWNTCVPYSTTHRPRAARTVAFVHWRSKMLKSPRHNAGPKSNTFHLQVGGGASLGVLLARWYTYDEVIPGLTVAPARGGTTLPNQFLPLQE
jgi:hypothetical protein